MDLEVWRAWQRIFRDFVIVLIGAFILVFETVVAKVPNPYLIGAGLAAFGLPPAFRLDRGKEDDHK